MKGAGMAIDLQFEANKALNALNSGQFNPALKTARAAIKAAPREAFFHNIAGLALSQMGKERDAIPYFQKAVALDPAFLEAQRNMAQALFMLGKFDRVHSLLDKLLVKNPNDNDALYLMAMSKTKEGDFKTAEAFATRAIETGANVARSLNLRAIIRKEIDNLGGAIDDYETSLALVPDNPDTLSNYSFTLALKGRSDEALAVLNKALEIAPDHLGTLIRIGGLLNEMGRKDESKAMFQRALAVAPDAHRTGSGQKLTADLESRLAAKGVRIVIVDASSLDGFATARAFYEAAGYVQEARLRDYWADGDDKIIYWKKLT